MFWTAFVWGLGVTVGGSFGLMSFVVLYAGWQWLTQTKAAKKLAEYNEASLAALDRRNELSMQMIEHLAKLAVAAERYEELLNAKKAG